MEEDLRNLSYYDGNNNISNKSKSINSAEESPLKNNLIKPFIRAQNSQDSAQLSVNVNVANLLD